MFIRVDISSRRIISFNYLLFWLTTFLCRGSSIECLSRSIIIRFWIIYRVLLSKLQHMRKFSIKNFLCLIALIIWLIRCAIVFLWFWTWLNWRVWLRLLLAYFFDIINVIFSVIIHIISKITSWRSLKWFISFIIEQINLWWWYLQKAVSLVLNVVIYMLNIIVYI